MPKILYGIKGKKNSPFITLSSRVRKSVSPSSLELPVDEHCDDVRS